MSPLAWLALAIILVVVVLLVAAALNPYREFEAEAHAHDSDDDLYIPGSVIPELDRLNDDPADPTTGELRAALRQTQEREAAETWKAFTEGGNS